MTQKIIQFLKGLFSTSKENHIQDQDVLRHDFKERYFFFKQLLTANNSALEGSAQIEKLLNESVPFGMSAVKANTTAVLVSVYRMIRKLDRLAPGKYSTLFGSYDLIERQINTILKQNQRPKDERLIIDLSEIDKTMSDNVGQKMANLGEMKNRLNLKVPEGFVMTARACDLFFRGNDLNTEINRKFKTIFSNDIEPMHACSKEIQDLILQAEIPTELSEQIEHAIDHIVEKSSMDLRFALRSSALGEDTLDSSFAGQYKTLLNIKSENILHAYKEILASKYSVTAIQYRLNRGFKDEDIDMCVGCLTMVDASSGGVAYTHHPFETHNDSIHIQSTWGLPKSVVDGTVNCDLFVVSRSPELKISAKEIHEKDKQFICYADEGECRLDFIDEMQSEPSLTQAQVLSIAEKSIDIQHHYGEPQDIEWAVINEGKDSVLYFLQCRPLRNSKKTDKAKLPDIKQAEGLIASGGLTASPGVAYGKVYTVKSETDLTRFPDKAVLVTQQALPRWAPLLGRASAVITEKGGFAGHLANVAREFDVPAIFGIQNACDLLSKEDRITLDADNKSIYRGKVAEILKYKSKKKNLMTGSPVYNILKEISKLITPLNLIDPDSPDFTPRNCKTLHDITRFIHEKSVAEMFNYGKNHGFDEVASKQLHDRVPMQWWVMNLDDGFKGDVTGKYVYLHDIASIPMIAVWEGIVAVPWDGPPPVDRKGLMSVMFQATANPALNTGVKTKYSQRNYFMISKHYCCLSSRLGFHFTTLESFVGERDSENYISFRFQGGAADQARRLKRVQFIGDILLKYGFKVTIKKDHLNARVKGYEKKYMIDRLKIIGYLSIHTRQLDMVITNRSFINRYFKKFESDIAEQFNIKMQSDSEIMNLEEMKDEA